MSEIQLTKIFSEGIQMTRKSYSHIAFPTIAMTLYIIAYFIYEAYINLKPAAEITGLDFLSGFLIGFAGTIISAWYIVVALNIVRESDEVKLNLAKIGWMILFWLFAVILYILILFIYLMISVFIISLLGLFGLLIMSFLNLLLLIFIVFFGVRLFYFMPELIMDYGKNPFVLLSKSWNLSKASFWKIVGLSFTISFFNLLGFLALGIGLLFTIPASQVIMMHFYNEVLKSNSETVQTIKSDK